MEERRKSGIHPIVRPTGFRYASSGHMIFDYRPRSARIFFRRARCGCDHLAVDLHHADVGCVNCIDDILDQAIFSPSAGRRH